MWVENNEPNSLQLRLALLKQQERELRNAYLPSHASLADTNVIEFKLTALAAEIADFESLVSSVPPAKTE